MSLTKEKPQPEKNEEGQRIITEKFCLKLCEFNGGYDNVEFNYNLYLHFFGFRKIENLDNFINLKVLYLESNCIEKIENLSNLKSLACLYLQNNYISKIENLDNNLELSVLNLSANKISKVENLNKLQKLESLYLAKNLLSSSLDIIELTSLNNLSTLDIQNNKFESDSNSILSTIGKIPLLKVLYFKGNDVIKEIKNYRRNLIVQLKNLTYLDDRPISEEDKVGAEAYLKLGFKGEVEAREKYKNENDKVRYIRNYEKELMKIPFEERKKLALNSLYIECDEREKKLKNKKKKIFEDIEKDPFDNGRKRAQIIAIDNLLEDNIKYKNDEIKNITFTISKRERSDQNINFIYEDWMDEILENKVIECFFDFDRALILIQLALKEKNVKNWNLFNKLDLRQRWSELEMEKFRKDNDNLVYNLTKEDIYPEKIRKEQEEEFLNQVKFIKKTEENNNNKKEESVTIKISEGDIDEKKLEEISTSKPLTLNDLDEID